MNIRMRNFIYTLLVAIFGLTSCFETKNSRHLDSNDYDSKKERVEILKKEIMFKSNFENAEFELFNVNGFSNGRTTVPGASSWDYKFVIKVKLSDADKWTEGMIKVEPKDYEIDWTKKIIEKRKNEWTTNSQPEFYTRKEGEVMLVLYRTEGIIFKRVINS